MCFFGFVVFFFYHACFFQAFKHVVVGALSYFLSSDVLLPLVYCVGCFGSAPFSDVLEEILGCFCKAGFFPKYFFKDFLQCFGWSSGVVYLDFY